MLKKQFSDEMLADEMLKQQFAPDISENGSIIITDTPDISIVDTPDITIEDVL